MVESKGRQAKSYQASTETGHKTHKMLLEDDSAQAVFIQYCPQNNRSNSPLVFWIKLMQGLSYTVGGIDLDYDPWNTG